MLKINEIFYSIQGEGSSIGKPALFIRLSGCNKSCSFCFGIKKNNGKVPRISLLAGGKKRIDDMEIGDKLLTYDDNFNVVETKVTNLIERKVKKWLLIKIDGCNYYVTPEHPFFTTIGLIKAEDLKVGDYIHTMEENKKSSYLMSKNNPMFDDEIKKKSIQNTDYKKIGEKVSASIKEKKKNGTYVIPYHTLTVEKQNELRKQASIRQMGEKNTRWSGGSDYPNWEFLKDKCRNFKTSYTHCSLCKDEKKLEVHHLDEDHENDDFENMITICHKCHSKIHQRGYNFWNGNRRDGKENLEAAINNNGRKVEYIKTFDINDKKQFPYPSRTPKPLNVYNISCEPYNTYIADNMWVHNCDSTYHEEIDMLMSEEKIVDKIKKIKPHTIIFTGGEPLLQQKEIVKFLEKYNDLFLGINIEFETNGSIMIEDDLMSYLDNPYTKNKLNISPKLKSSGNEPYKLNILDNLKNLDISIKFVYSIEDEGKEILEFLNNKQYFFNKKVYIMPEGASREKQNARMQEVINFCLKYKFNFSPRLHVLVWDKKGELKNEFFGN